MAKPTGTNYKLRCILCKTPLYLGHATYCPNRQPPKDYAQEEVQEAGTSSSNTEAVLTCAASALIFISFVIFIWNSAN